MMNSLIFLYTVTVLIAAALAAIAVWAPRSVWLKLSALGLAAMLMTTGYTALVEILGRPKPVAVEWAAQKMQDAIVVATRMREGESIYLWLEFGETSEPRAYALPWNLNVAKQLNQAIGQAKAKGTKVRMRKLLESGSDLEEPLFYAEPQQALPPKISLAN